jgi:hypothetical protein
MLHILRVYWRYYYGKLRGWDMRLFGRPGLPRFKVVRMGGNLPVVVQRMNADDVEPMYGLDYWIKPWEPKP